MNAHFFTYQIKTLRRAKEIKKKKEEKSIPKWCEV